MNERIRELIMQSVNFRLDPDSDAYEAQVSPEDLEYLAQSIVRECMTLCEQVAVYADKTAKGAFVTDAGRMLHEGMWGGAKNCGGQIEQHFEVEP